MLVTIVWRNFRIGQETNFVKTSGSPIITLSSQTPGQQHGPIKRKSWSKDKNVSRNNLFLVNGKKYQNNKV